MFRLGTQPTDPLSLRERAGVRVKTSIANLYWLPQSEGDNAPNTILPQKARTN